MNILFKKLNFGIRSVSYLKIGHRFLFTYINNNIDSKATNYINNALSKDPLTSEGILNLLKDVANKLNFYSNDTTKASIKNIWEEADRRHIKMDITHFNFLMEYYLRNDINFDPVEMLKDISKRNISFNNITFDILLKNYCKIGDLTSAMKLVDKMVQTNIYLNSTKYSWLIGCAIKNKNQEQKEKYMQEIKTNDLVIPVSGYAFISDAYASILDIDNCIDTFKQSELIYGKNDRHTKNLCHSYYELAKANASEEHLLKICQLINENQDIRHFMSTFIKLSKLRLFAAGNFLLKNMECSLTEEEYIHLAKILVHLKPPFEDTKFLLSKINNRRFDKFLIKNLSPFEEAYKIAQRYTQECDKKELKGLSFNLIVNASKSTDPINKFKLILGWLRMQLPHRECNKCVIGVCISIMLESVPDKSYFNLISALQSYLQNDIEIGFVSCCVFHAICFRDLSEAQQLLEKYPLVKEANLPFSYMDYAHSLLDFKDIDGVCQSVFFMKTIMVDQNFRALLTAIISCLTFIKSSQSLTQFLTTVQEFLTESILINLRESGKISKENLEIIENISNKNLLNSRSAI